MTSYTSFLSDNTLAIFLLHGVVNTSSYRIRNYTRKHLEKDYFCEVMRELKKAGNPLSMQDVVELHQEGKPYPPNAFAITFDDGFENNYSVAAPVLKDLRIPATFYITTGFIENNGMSWIDRIEYCLEQSAPTHLDLPWEGASRSLATAEETKRALDAIRKTVKNDSDIDVDALIADIYRQCNMTEVTASDDPLDRKMTWDQIQSLHGDELFTIGGHTHTHAIMSFLSPEVLEQEIDTSLSLLARQSGVKTSHYSYPEGLAHCFSHEVIAALKKHGIVCSPTAIEGVNRPSDGLFHLKRIFIT